MQCQQVKQALSQQQSRLQKEEMRLHQLEEYQKHYVWSETRQANGLLLNSAHMMAQSVDHAVQHQRQQVGVQQAQCRSTRNKYINERMQLRTADTLLNSHQQVLKKKEARQEQKIADEYSGRMLFFSNE